MLRSYKALSAILLLLTLTSPVMAEPDYAKLLAAIYRAEGGSHTSHPYGIMRHYRHTTPRQACLNTLKHRWAEYALLKPLEAQRSVEGYLRHVQRSYCPIGAKNDPSNLNVNWLNNVRRLYEPNTV